MRVLNLKHKYVILEKFHRFNNNNEVDEKNILN
jgi:hypothetical protein